MKLSIRHGRRGLAVAGATALVAAGLVAVTATAAHAAAACRVDYQKTWDNGSGFGANVVINNLGDPISGWTLTYTWPGNQGNIQGWSANWSQSGANVTATNLSWNATVATGASVTIGFNASYSGTNANPSTFFVNGTACTGQAQQQALVVSPTNLTVAEGRTATYAVRLQTQPAGSVTVTSTAGSGDADLTLQAGATLTFTTTNWSTAQTVTVAAAEDADTANGTRPFTVASSGLTSVVVTATEQDNDPAQQQALVVTPTAVSVPEGGTATYAVRLQVQPTSTVTVTSTAGSGDADLTVSAGATRTFTTSNWSTAQTVTLAAAEDADTANGTRSVTVSSTGLASVVVTATEADNDTTGAQALVVTPTSATVPEGGTATYAVRLQAQPASTVTVSSTGGTGDADITVSAGGTLTFTTANWNANQNVTLAAAEDSDSVNGSRTITVASSGLTPVTVTATEADNDVTGRVDNPYAGATVYNNPDWRARANSEPGGSRVANQPTGVWLDRIAAIAGTSGAMGLRAHLDAAVNQDAANGAAPLVVQFVIYDLPGRDCAALASNGELGPTELPRYETDYIDPIAAILGDPRYAALRIVLVIEIDSIPNLVTNVSGKPGATALCDQMLQNGNYVNGIGYALKKLGAIPNVYNYIDAAHHGWIGWTDNFNATAQMLYQAATANGATPANVQGFITNTANYSALQEPYIDINGTVGGQQIRSSAWVDWNSYNDELSFAQAFRQQLITQGFASTIGMLIDTSRNGWGGSARPTGPSPSTDLNTFVNQSRIDRRIHKGNWCNQSGAGLGERPRANPALGIDAYVWIKPPGESDGSSTAIPNDEGKGFDQMCDPTYTGNARNGYNLTGALPDAPLSGQWFSAQFQQLMANAYPAL